MGGTITGRMGPHKEIRMKAALVTGLLAVALGAASSTTALAQVKKDVAPSANTSASKAAVLPSGAAVQGGQGQSAATSNNTGVAQSNMKSSDKARSN
jgi:hypothetical protein